MDRRAFLAGVAGGLAGCGTRRGRQRGDDPGGTARDDGTPTATHSESSPNQTATEASVPDVCEVASKDVGIEAVTGPTFADDWSGVSVESYEPLADDSVVVGLELDGRARAYPLTVLWWHEVVNDAVPTDAGQRPVLVTYCSLCASGMVAERVVDGDPTAFGVSGRLWRPPAAEVSERETSEGIFGADLPEGEGSDARVRNDLNLVLYDAATGSYWSQLLAEAICGPRRGERLALLPATATIWGEWREAHPDTEVLLPPPHSRVLNPPYPADGPPGG